MVIILPRPGHTNWENSSLKSLEKGFFYSLNVLRQRRTGTLIAKQDAASARPLHAEVIPFLNQ
jgi:hypothetical protein